jgi:DNA-binding LytR/AlgR family response regulator
VVSVRIAICEDNEEMQECLTKHIDDWAAAHKFIITICCYPDAEAFEMEWPDTRFDLIFLDIQMKDMTGIELAELIRETDSNMLIIFLTSHTQYALRGYDVSAFHYLIKPLSSAKLLPILDKAYSIWQSSHNASITVDVDSGKKKLLLNDILYIEKNLHIATIRTHDKSYEVRKTLEQFEQLLPSHFARCHRSYIVNVNKIDCLYRESLLLPGGKDIPVSRNKMKAVRDAFMRLYTG